MKVTTSTEAKVIFFPRNERKKNTFLIDEKLTKQSSLGLKLEFKTTVNGYWCHGSHMYKRYTLLYVIFYQTVTQCNLNSSMNILNEFVPSF